MPTKFTIQIAKTRFRLSILARQIGGVFQLCEALLSVRATWFKESYYT
jgi:hypothetical protein